MRWAKSSGDVTLPPKIDDLETYGISWKAWYMSVMPKNRVGQKSWPPLRKPVDPIEWDCLRKGSKKGFVELLMSLSWWEAQATRKKHKSTVETALQDVLYVVRQLAAHEPGDDSSTLHKRARGPDDSSVPPRRRCV
jgi:hypothetical protein